MSIDVSIGLIGFGNIGRRLLRELLKHREDVFGRHGLRLNIVFIADSKGVLYGKPYVENQVLIKALGVERGKISSLPGGVSGEYAITAIDDTSPDIVVDTTPGNYVDAEPAYSFLVRALNRGADVVTANKAPLALRFPELLGYARSRRTRIFFKACVMSGAPLVDLVIYGLRGQTIKSFTGILNATSNYILGLLEKSVGVDIEYALKIAVEKGVAEPDPSLDLKGIDLAAKGVILYSIAFRPLTIRETVIKDVIDDGLKTLLAKTLRSGYKIKYVVEFTDRTLPTVRLVTIDKNSPLYSVDGTSNAALLELDNNVRFFLKADNLGPDSTVAALLSDIILASETRSKER